MTTGSTRSRRGLLAAVVFGVLVGGGGIALLVATDSDDGEVTATASNRESATTRPGTPESTDLAARPTATSIPLDELPDGAKQFVALATKGLAATFHAKFEAQQAASPTAPSYSLAVEIWNQAPQTRRDVHLSTPESEVITSEFQLAGDQVVRCGKPDAGTAWSCVAVAAGQTPQEPGSLGFGLAPSVLSGQPVQMSERTIGDRAATCFAVAVNPGTAPDEVCLSADDGIPLEFSSGGSRLELSLLEENVPNPDTTFQPPAEAPPAAPTTTTP